MRGLLITLVALAATGMTCAPAIASTAAPSTCSELANVKPSEGRSFHGTMQNDDYHFVAKIPDHLIAWDGVAPEAPFHGFVIFPYSTTDTCIVLEIHKRVNELDAPMRPAKGKQVHLGTATAWQTSSIIRHGTSQSVMTTRFSARAGHATEDGLIELIAPRSKFKAALTSYNAFLASLKFY